MGPGKRDDSDYGGYQFKGSKRDEDINKDTFEDSFWIPLIIRLLALGGHTFLFPHSQTVLLASRTAVSCK